MIVDNTTTFTYGKENINASVLQHLVSAMPYSKTA